MIWIDELDFLFYSVITINILFLPFSWLIKKFHVLSIHEIKDLIDKVFSKFINVESVKIYTERLHVEQKLMLVVLLLYQILNISSKKFEEKAFWIFSV